MHICYSSTPEPFNTAINLRNANATKIYLNHYYNYLYLNFIASKSNDYNEKHQANKELLICARKLAFWEKHPNFDRTIALNETQKLKKDWNSK